jgi:hypothetical protein
MAYLDIVANRYVAFWIDNVQNEATSPPASPPPASPPPASPSTSKKKWKWFENSASVIVNFFTMINYNYVDNKTAFDNMSLFLIVFLNVLFLFSKKFEKNIKIKKLFCIFFYGFSIFYNVLAFVRKITA